MAVPSQLSLYNGALRIIKHRRLTSLTEETEGRRLLDEEYAETLDYCLEQGYWNFASRMVELEASDDEETTFGFQYTFQKPTDYVRLVRISHSEFLYPTLEDLDYTDEGEYWFSSINPLYVQYISNDDLYGANFNLWPAVYTLYVQHELAFRIAPHLTSYSGNELQVLERARDRALKDARSKDAMAQGVMRPPPGRLTQSRSRRMGVWGGSGGRPWWR